MCGIYAQFGSFKLNDALECLKRLEYRGYDSFGISYNNNEIRKRVGRIKLFSEEENYDAIRAICHTRWATNGEVSLANAHPQMSSDGKVVLVHNGVLENEGIIKQTYFKNHEFKSSTDSEVIAELLAYFLRSSSPLKAILDVMDVIKGAYAILFMIKDDNNIYFMKNKSSLIIGYNQNSYFMASDIYALPHECSYYKHLTDKSYGRIGADVFLSDESRFLNFDFNYEFQTPNDVMIKEIYEEELLALKLKNNNNLFSNKTLELIRNASELIIIGSGSSFYAGEYISYMCEDILKKRARAFLPTELRNADLYDNPIYLVISQSGETADLINAIDNVNKDRCILFTNRKNSSLGNMIKNVVDVLAGAELAVASTKSFNQTIIAAYMLFQNVMDIKEDEIGEYVEGLRKIKNNFEMKIPKLLAEMDKVFYIGQGYDYIISKEGALKLKEIAYIPTEGYSISELKHGSLALIDSRTTVIGLSSIKNYMLATLNEVKSRHGNIFYLESPYKGKYLGGLVLARYVQLISYYTAKEKGLDPDHPRNLAKSVTVI